MENKERVKRFDYLKFLPRLNDPVKAVVRALRSLFGWSQEKEFLRNEIEIIALHERELLDTLNDTNRDEIEYELDELKRQKRSLLRRYQKKAD
ncbi:MAG: hypothetical protein ACKVOH_00465 [Chlamydiales bacterium]